MARPCFCLPGRLTGLGCPQPSPPAPRAPSLGSAGYPGPVPAAGGGSPGRGAAQAQCGGPAWAGRKPAVLLPGGGPALVEAGTAEAGLRRARGRHGEVGSVGWPVPAGCPGGMAGPRGCGGTGWVSPVAEERGAVRAGNAVRLEQSLRGIEGFYVTGSFRSA